VKRAMTPSVDQDRYEQTSSCLWIPRRANRRPVGVDLFCGCGGFSLGMAEGDVDVAFAADWEVSAAETYLLNLGRRDCQVLDIAANAKMRRTFWRYTQKLGAGWIGSANPASEGDCRAFWLGDIHELTGDRILQAIDEPSVDIVFGGPPCQGMSKSNSTAGLLDPRNQLLFEFMRIVEELRPKAFCMENVPPLLTTWRPLYEEIECRGCAAGYTVTATIIDAANYGVPQFRRRALILGALGGKPLSFPMPSTWMQGRRPDGTGWNMKSRNEEEDGDQGSEEQEMFG